MTSVFGRVLENYHTRNLNSPVRAHKIFKLVTGILDNGVGQMVVIDPSKIDFFYMVPHSRNKVIATAKDMTMLYGEFEPGAEFPKHSHLHQQIGYCLKGKCELWIEGKTYVVKEGYAYSIPSNAKHSWRNIGEEKYVFVEVFYPARDDLLKGEFKEEFWEKKS